eukprot:1028552-Rhodomonas_salina.2
MRKVSVLAVVALLLLSCFASIHISFVFQKLRSKHTSVLPTQIEVPDNAQTNLKRPQVPARQRAMYRGALHSNISLAEVLPVCDEVEKTDGPGRKQKKEGRGGEKVVLITALFGAGSVKPFLPFFLKSMRQSGFDVMIISDQPIDPEMLRSSAGRVWHLNLSLSDLGQRVQTKIPECVVDLSQMTGYKIVDLRPLFGVLLEEELRNYSMWGHVDNDMLIGRVKHYLQKAGAFKGSIEVAPAQIVVNTFGPLTLYRNSCRINHLFRRSPVKQSEILGSKFWTLNPEPKTLQPKPMT